MSETGVEEFEILDPTGDPIEVPRVLPVLPVRDVVVFPGVTVPLTIGRQRSLAALEEAAKEKLVIIIAHRLSTIRRSNRILFLEDGEIREQGSHEQLMAIPEGSYRTFVELQN